MRESRERRILNQLRFREIHARHEEIGLVHRETIEWLFHETQPGEMSWTNFMEWLQNDNSIYWINGKAGSGKSTLMKFISDDSRLMEALRISPWANGRSVIKCPSISGTTEHRCKKAGKDLCNPSYSSLPPQLHTPVCLSHAALKAHSPLASLSHLLRPVPSD